MLPVWAPGICGEGYPPDQGGFKQLFELTPDPTWIIDENQFVDCSEAAIKTLGYFSRDELLNVAPEKLSPTRQADGEDSWVKAEPMMASLKQGVSPNYPSAHQNCAMPWRPRAPSSETELAQINRWPATGVAARELM